MKSLRNKFKQYQQNQLMAIPPTFEELIAPNHPVRIVNEVIDQIDLKPIMRKYKVGGCTSYHPRMLLKVLVYGYLCNVYSSRKIEAATQENIYFMWLSAMAKPDHNTINRFRSEKLKGHIKKVFTQVVLLMVESGHVDLQKVYTDGTKIESCANRYTFVWSKSIKKSKERIIEQLEELWNYAQTIAQEEMKDTTPTSFDELGPDKLRETINAIDEALRDKPVSKAVKKKISYARKHWPENMQKYERAEQILDGRNSFSKTDPDATFMRMKEDHMKNGQLKPAYNVQISTNNQIITNYTVHQNPADTTALKPHIESFKDAYAVFPNEITADAGYGSEENLEYLEQNHVDAYVKYNYFDREQKLKDRAKADFHPDNLHYNKEQNCYYCPIGQKMNFIGNQPERTVGGYIRMLSHYIAQNCQGCPMRCMCHKGAGNRIIEVSHRLNELKSKVRERLYSEKGIIHRKQRPVDVEPVFGMIKSNRNFKRFMLRGLEKVGVEFGLLAISHNLKKIAV